MSRPSALDVAVHVGGFVLVGFVVLLLSGGLLQSLEAVSRSAVVVFLAGVAANLIFSWKLGSARSADYGLPWDRRGGRQLVAGILAGVLLVVGIVGGVAVAGWGSFAEAPVDRSAGVLAITLLLGAVGEELLFRGYAFQYLERYWAWPTLLGSGLLFGLAHLSNRNVHWLAAANTALWGCLLGYAYVRTRRLWLPVGLHYGWNLALALSTSNMSGLTIGATAWTLRWSAGELWSGGAYGLEGGLFATLAAIPAFWFVRRMR